MSDTMQQLGDLCENPESTGMTKEVSELDNY